MLVDVGSKAPDFTLMDQDRSPVTLSALQGQPVVLAFFPAAFSGVCTKELCRFRDQLSELNRTQARVFGISVDTFFALKAFQQHEQLTFPLLSDFNKTAIRDYGVVNPDMIGLCSCSIGRASSGTARCSMTPGTSRTINRCSTRSRACKADRLDAGRVAVVVCVCEHTFRYSETAGAAQRRRR